MGIFVVQAKMVSFSVEWTLFGKSLGEENCSYEFTKGQRHIPFSIAYCCTKCGSVWAKIKVLDKNTKWYFYPRDCPVHGTGYLMPSSDSSPFVSTAPVEVMLREILLYTEQLVGPNPDKDYAWALVI